MLDIVIVNWNSGPQLKECVDSVIAHSGDLLAQVIVVDNGSADGSVDEVEGLSGVKVIRAEENLGFGAACNIGAAIGDAQYVLFLNPDTRVEAESLSAPLDFLNRIENVRVGICGVQLVNEDDAVSPSCSRFPSLSRLTVSALGLQRLSVFSGKAMRMIEWDHAESRRVDQVMGAFFLIWREVYEGLDGFDERFFVYFEEVDLAYRAYKVGWESWYLSGVRAFHAGGGTSQQVKARRLFYSLRSRLLYGFKHFPRYQSWMLVGVTVAIEPIVRFVWCASRRDKAGAEETWAAYRMLWRGMSRIVRGQGRFVP